MQNEGEMGSLFFPVTSPKKQNEYYAFVFILPLSRDINYPQTAQVGDGAVSYHVERRAVKAS